MCAVLGEDTFLDQRSKLRKRCYFRIVNRPCSVETLHDTTKWDVATKSIKKELLISVAERINLPDLSKLFPSTTEDAAIKRLQEKTYNRTYTTVIHTYTAMLCQSAVIRFREKYLVQTHNEACGA